MVTCILFCDLESLKIVGEKGEINNWIVGEF